MTVDVASHEQHIIRSWHSNAEPWARAIKTASIPSRQLVTNQAIIKSVTARQPQRVLDVGCGEGWLARALGEHGIEVLGFDAVPALIDEARRLSSGRFLVHSYADLTAHRLSCDPVEVAVCNFSLLGEQSVDGVLQGLAQYLVAHGVVIIQTLHPFTACGAEAYRDGWRAGSWAGFSQQFIDPAPWYFRTLGSWFELIARCGFELLDFQEPTAADAALPASAIFTCGPRDARSS